MPELKLIIDNDTLDRYHEYYFEKYPRRKKKPIDKPTPPTLNKFTSMVRMAQNNLKQKYKEFSIWLVKDYGLDNLNLEKAHITYRFYFKDRRRRDVDNVMLTPKFLNDGFVEANLLKDDSGDNLSISFDPFEHDKENPRIEMFLKY